MVNPSRYPWMVISLGTTDVPTRVSVETHRGERFEEEISWGVPGPQLVDVLERESAPFEGWPGPHPRTLPVFVHWPGILDPSKPIGDFMAVRSQLDEFLSIASITNTRARTVQMTEPSWKARVPAKLPMRAVAVGPGAAVALTDIQNEWWVQTPEMQEAGLTFATLDPGQVATATARDLGHVVITDERGAWATLGRVADARRGDKPRLVIVLAGLDFGFGDSLWPQDLPSALGGTSLLLVRTGGPPPTQFVRSIFYGLAHDLALHDVAGTAAEQTGFQDAFMLFSDPAANQALRLVGFLELQVEEALDAEAFTALGVAEAAPDMAAVLPEDFLRSARDAEDASAMLEDLSARARVLPLDVGGWTHEARGLKPMAEYTSKFRRAMAAYKPQRSMLRKLAEEPQVRDVVEKRQQRKVHIGLFRDIGELVQSIVTGTSLGDLEIEPDQILATDRPYRVGVRVGRPFRVNLFEGESTPIDPLLPTPKKDKKLPLDIVVFPLDFGLDGPALRRVELPPLGATKTAWFSVHTPHDTGTARLRVGVYYGNHLVQSFLLEATVDTTERRATGQELGVRTTLAFSRTEKIRDLKRFGERLVSIGMNSNGNGDTHDFMWKGKGKPQGIRLLEGQLDRVIRPFRQTLVEATTDDGKTPVFPAEKEDPNPARFDDVLRSLAYQGRELWLGLFQNFGPIRPTLSSLRRAKNGIVQVTSFNPNFVFPWAGVYDFKLKKSTNGLPPLPVCRGIENGSACTHDASSADVVCINGFWGVRHQIELLATELTANNEIPEALPRSTDRAIHLAFGVNDDSTRTIQPAVEKTVGVKAVRRLGVSEDVLATLWDAATRPSVLVLVGHVDEIPGAGELPTGRLNIEPVPQQLEAGDLLEMIDERKELKKPRPLILMLGCGSGVIKTETFSQLLVAAWAAGAAAVVGTECIAFTGLVSRFAREVLDGMWGGKTLGQEVQTFRRKLLERGNPLGFVVTAYGDAELTVAKS